MPEQELPRWSDEHRQRVEELVDKYRIVLHDALNDLTEEEARRRLVPSKTTLLGLVKHATFVEGVWFDQAVAQHAGHAEILREQILADRTAVNRRDAGAG